MKRLKSGHIVFLRQKEHGHWLINGKSGFYHIANNSHLPISIGYIDYQQKNQLELNKFYTPVEISAKDCDTIRTIYKTITPKHPHLFDPNWHI